MLQRLMSDQVTAVDYAASEAVRKQRPASVPELPKEMMSEDRKARLAYLRRRDKAMQAKVPGMEDGVWQSIVQRVPQHLRNHDQIPREQRNAHQKAMVQLYEALTAEVKQGHESVLRRLTVASVVRPPPGVKAVDDLRPTPLEE